MGSFYLRKIADIVDLATADISLQNRILQQGTGDAGNHGAFGWAWHTANHGGRAGKNHASYVECMDYFVESLIIDF